MKTFGKVGSVLAGVALSTSLFASTTFAEAIEVNHIDWMKEESILKGNQSGNYKLNQHVKLADTLIFLARTKGVEGLEESTGKNFAEDYIQWAKSNDAISDDQAKFPHKQLSSDEVTEIASKLGYELALEDSKKVTREDFLTALGEAVVNHITIGHTNDIHGHIEENSFGGEYGYAKISTLINEWRAENENFLLLDGGDTFQGTVLANEYKGESLLPILNYLDYDVMAAGNHEFDFGYEQTLKLRDALNYPMISANVFKPDGTELLIPVHYEEVAGKKFAFVGFVAEDTPVLTHPDNVAGLTFKSPVEVAKELIPEVQKQVDNVIVVSHVGVTVDRQIAEAVDGIDLIVGGHSHTPLTEPELVNGTYIVQDWEYGKSLGRADLYYYNDEVIAFDGGLVEYDETVEADPEVAAMVEKIVTEIDEKLNVTIATTDVHLDGARDLIRSQETNLGNLITDIMLEKTLTIDGYNADVVLTNGGGIRDEIPAGDITKKMLNTVLPFPNTLVVIDVTGEELKAALEHGVSGVEEGAGRFAQIAGMSFTYDSTKPAGERVLEVKVGEELLDESKTYKLATNDFVGVGGDGYEMFANKEMFNTGFTLYSVVEEGLMSRETVSPVVEGRIVDVASNN
ncbi:bifunctional metallophosphatase/5'-nucleotidase [Bacillus sp. SCS-151]|uniref:bifunctional metallophosphatase/5'-nucleotidase n=1 Tax=Nanhaiella sioensis TaxID=3115293 RepID=UPI00397CB028